MRRLIIFGILMLIVCRFGFAEEKIYPCCKFAKEPVLDGKVKDDPAWKNIPIATGFLKLGTESLSDKQTFFRIGYTSEALFIGIECEEPEIKWIKAKGKDMDPSLWQEDSVEIFVFPNPKELDDYYQFTVNTIGSRFNTNAEGVVINFKMPLGNWQARSYKGGNYYSIEIKLPWAIFYTLPEKGEEWRFNICRNIYTSGDRHTNWAYLKYMFHEPRNFAKIIFKNDIPLQEKKKGISKIVSRIKREIAANLKRAKSSSLPWKNDASYLENYRLIQKGLSEIGNKKVNPEVLKESQLLLKKSKNLFRLRSLSPIEILNKLNLDYPGLVDVKRAAKKGERSKALNELLKYYRSKYPMPEEKIDKEVIEKAEKVVNHIFQFLHYKEAAYGKDINWDWDPRHDLEWVGRMHAFDWLSPLASSFAATGDEKYAQKFVELTCDYIKKYPLENYDIRHPIYQMYCSLAWAELYAPRAATFSSTFPIFIHAKAFTPEFLGIFLSNIYDCQIKTELFPMLGFANKSMSQISVLFKVAKTFPEFADSKKWMRIAVERFSKNLSGQITSDGVQKEWAAGYNCGVASEAANFIKEARSAGVRIPKKCLLQVKRMYDYIFAMTTPDLCLPIFGDCGRTSPKTQDRTKWPMYKFLLNATELFNDPKYAARGRLDRIKLPKQKSYAFKEAGMYFMRSDWGPEQIYFALHCSPMTPICGCHDQPDNGTFELYAYGRWLMTDSGRYDYHRPIRAWFRQTKVHQTLTLEGRNSKVGGQHLLWYSTDSFDALVVENPSYKGLSHRRTVWFVDKKYFVLLDEAIGDVKGEIDLHYQLAVGDAKFDCSKKRVYTTDDEVNVLVWMSPKAPVELQEEEGWFSWTYGKRKKRTAFRFRHKKEAPVYFITVIAPYKGTSVPEVSANLTKQFSIGADEIELDVSAFGKNWRIGRDLKTGKVWCIKRK